MIENNDFVFDVSLSVVEDLGRNLYTSVPAVLSELVANAYDADATEVRISINGEAVSIVDNGNGMSIDDVKRKYLTVGFKRRLSGEERSPVYHRAVMGRKGIGKLAVFAISNEVTVSTAKQGSPPIGLKIDYNEIVSLIKRNDGQKYIAPEVAPKPLPAGQGTRLDLIVSRRMSSLTPDQLRKRIARRFHAIGDRFRVFINDHEVTARDRDLLTKAEYLWVYGTEEISKEDYPNIKHIERRPNSLDDDAQVSGWIASTTKPVNLKEADDYSLNRIPVFARGKVAHEDLLKYSTDARIYTKYLFGELDAEFLDLDDEDDIATSSRQSVREDDPRFVKLVEFLKQELLHIREAWSSRRVVHFEGLIDSIPELKTWSEKLSSDERKRFQQLIGRFVKFGWPEDKKSELIKFSVIAFETFKLKTNLELLESLDVEDFAQWASVFASIDSFEAACYLQITTTRLKAIKRLKDLVRDDKREKFLQEFIAQELWLLDHTWDPVSEAPYVEQNMKDLVEGLKQQGDSDERNGRVDIKYAKANFGKHIIIELKRSSVRTPLGRLFDQASKYLKAMKDQLERFGRAGEQVEIVILVGDLSEGDTRDRAAAVLGATNARVVFYEELIANAEASYKKYIEGSAQKDALLKVLSSVDDFLTDPED